MILTKLIVQSVGGSAVLHAAAFGFSAPHLVGCHAAPLPARQGGLPTGAAAAAILSQVVNHHHGGIHASQRVHAALARRVKTCGAQVQLVVARHLYERTPSERSLKAGPEPAAIGRFPRIRKNAQREKALPM